MMISRLLMLFISVIIFSQCLSFSFANVDFVAGCNGFVKSEIIGNIDFSKVEVKLFTKQGSLKEKTECAPNNGYYFLPLYNEGEYVLKVESPVGWNFEPAEVAINVDGLTDPCTLGKDINFSLQGFAITGQVTSLGETVGPKGVSVSLLLTKKPTEVLLTTTTKDRGNFLLSPVKPGQYIVEISHDRWHLTKKRVAVSVSDGNLAIAPDHLVVTGYDVAGQVTSDNEPILGVSFVLFNKASSKPVTVIGCDTSALSGFSSKGLDLNNLVPVCHVSSDDKGRFIFPTLAPGTYSVIPYYKGVHSIKFDVHPQRLEFDVKHGSLELSTIFQVRGFSVNGRVVWSQGGKPLEGAAVLIDNKVVTKADSNGVFHLDSMSPGMYKMLIQAPEVLFEEQSVRVTPNTPQLGDLWPAAYRISGRVSAQSSGPSVVKREVLLQCQVDGHAVMATTDDAGIFHTFLHPGTYKVSVPVSDAERENGLQFAPLVRTLKIVDRPATGVDFSQLRATVKGSVQCLGGCLEILVTLQANDLSNITAQVKGGNYLFENVLPGEYSVSLPTQDWCWQKEIFPLIVATEKVDGPTFVQIGLPINFVSSHATKVYYRPDNNSTGGVVSQVELAAGHSRVCVLTPGSYVIEPVGCHGYASPTVRWTTGDVILTAVSHLYTGRVTAAETVSDLVINVIPADDSTSPTKNVRRLGPLTAQRLSEGNGVYYEFSTQLAPGESVTLVPSASSLLFTPSSAAVLGGNDCTQGVDFNAERGSVVEGRVVGNKLAVSGAAVSIRDPQGQLVATQITDNDGRYMFGPLSANIKYNVTAQKEGYIMSGPDSKGEFSAHKLAEVLVTVKDKADGQPLQGVLLSLSGGENYRRNSQTSSDGSMAFLSLSPSQYFLRPMMKEYKFDPPSKMIAVQEGATVQVELSGQRVAYSVLGSVTSLSGDPEPGVVVEAEGQGSAQCSQLQEESSSETNGQFRIRGLHPQCEYIVRVKQGSQVNQHIQRSTPEGFNVKVGKEDVVGLTIIVFRPISRTDVSVLVTTESPEHLHSLRVKMIRDDTTIHTVRLSSLKATPSFALTTTTLVFPPVPADARTYTIQLESTLSTKTHDYRTHPVYFKANSSFQLVRLNFAAELRAGDSELSHSSYFALPLMLAALLVFYYWETVKALLSQLKADSAFTPLQPEHSSLDASSSELISGKRKIKARKT